MTTTSGAVAALAGWGSDGSEWRWAGEGRRLVPGDDAEVPPCSSVAGVTESPPAVVLAAAGGPPSSSSSPPRSPTPVSAAVFSSATAVCPPSGLDRVIQQLVTSQLDEDVTQRNDSAF